MIRRNTPLRQRSPSRRVSSLVLLLTAAGIVLFGVFLNLSFVVHRRHDSQQEQLAISMQAPPKKFTKVPQGHAKTFKYDGNAISRPMVRALRRNGWQLVNKEDDAQIIFYYSTTARLYTQLQPWQRFNNIPNYKAWNQKDSFIDGFKEYEESKGITSNYIPESYRLSSEKEQASFLKRITEQGGIQHPWVLKQPRVNQGKGIEMVAPNSERLVEIAHFHSEDVETEDYIIQRYICNEDTWNARKYDVRMFWFVASLDPLVVLYQDGYVRIGNAVYDEGNFDNNVAHLTTHTGLGEEGKATFAQFEEHLEQHAKKHGLKHVKNPVEHVRNQFKDSLAEFVDAFKDISFGAGLQELSSENGFGFYGSDFILDNDLDVWLIEPQKGCGMDEDCDFRIDMHDHLFRGMVSTLEEVWQKQEAGELLLPLENTGDWELIYANGWKYHYDGYARSQNKAGCQLQKTA